MWDWIRERRSTGALGEVVPPVGGLVCGLGNEPNAPTIKERGEPSLYSYGPRTIDVLAQSLCLSGCSRNRYAKYDVLTG